VQDTTVYFIATILFYLDDFTLNSKA